MYKYTQLLLSIMASRPCGTSGGSRMEEKDLKSRTDRERGEGEWEKEGDAASR